MNNNNQNQNKRKPQSNQSSPNNKQNTPKLSVQQPLQSSNSNNNNKDESLKLIKERTLFTAMSLVGYIVQITCKNGNIYEGVLHSINTPSNNNNSGGSGLGVVLKMARRKESPQTTITTQPTPTMLIEAKDFVGLVALGVALDSSSSSGSTISPPIKGQTIHTDTDISGFSGVLRERELVQWTSDSAFEESLESSSSNSGSGGVGSSSANSGISNSGNAFNKWDQFTTNEVLFGVKTTYDEGLYTTHLDKDSEFYKSNVHLAERKASEIENDKNINNLHILEERGHIQGSDYDEEERYSSVVRKNQSTNNNNNNTSPQPRVPLIPNSDKYIPPSERSRILQQQQSNSPTTTPKSDNNKSKTVIDIPATTSPITTDKTSAPSTPKTNITPLKDFNNGIDKQNTPTTKDSSPNVSKLIFNRDNNKPVEEDHGVLGSPRDGLSPRFVEYMKVKKDLSDSKTPKSPLVNNKELLTSLSLELSTNNKPDVLSDFNNFKLNKSKESVDRQSQLELYKSFSREMNMKSKSRPNSPLTSSPRIAVPLPSSFSLTSSKDQQPDEIKDDKKDIISTTTSTTTTSTTTTTITKDDTTKDEPKIADTTSTPISSSTSSTPQPTSTNSSTSSLSKFKLNPNAKTFTPSQTSTKVLGTSLELNKSANGTSITTTDTHSSINDVYYDSMKKRQVQMEPSDTISQYWIDPYSRQPMLQQVQYDEDPYGNPYPMRPTIAVGMPIPFYPPGVMQQPPNPSGKGNMNIQPQMIHQGGGKPGGNIYSPQGTPPRGTYTGPPQNQYVTFAPQPPPHFQYVPQTVVFGNPQMVGGMPPPQQHHPIQQKRYYAGPSTQPPPPYGQPTIISIPNQPPVSSPNRMISSPTYPPPPYGMGK